MWEELRSRQARIAGRPALADAGIALLVLGVTLQPLIDGRGCGCDPAPWGYLLVAGQCVPLAWRRRFPFVVALVSGAFTGVYGVLVLPDPAVPFAGLVGLYSAAAHARRPLSLLAAAIAAVAITVALLLDAVDADAQDFTVNYLVFATAWLLGDSVRSRRAYTAELEDRADRAERARAAEAARAVVEERNRIARELHDVVAHSVSLMVVQAEAGAASTERDPRLAEQAFDGISATGRRALAEMRRLLGVLRTDDLERRLLAPQPSVSELGALVDELADAGLPVRLVVEGDAVPLSPAVELTVYRIVQEALTNSLRHAGPARASVRLAYGGDVLDVRVSDDGTAGTVVAGGGNGLAGMRERVAMVGGRMSAGPCSEGGFEVRARLPYNTVT